MHPAPHLPDRRSERRPLAPTTLVAVAHRPEWLGRTCRGVGTFLVFRSVAGVATDGPLAGIWLVPPGAGEPAFTASCVSPLPLVETVGVGGVWTLCWFRGHVPRETLVATLAGAAPGAAGGGTFVPVFRADERGAADAEQRRLADRFPGVVAAPLCHHVGTGRVVPFPAAR